MSQPQMAVFDASVVSYQNSQIHKDLLAVTKGQIKRRIIEKEDDIEKIGETKYKIYNPRGAVSVRKVLKRKHFSAKA